MRDDAPGPFPSNPLFLHQPVLSERSRDRIHKMVSDDDMPIMAVSAQLGVDHRRVAAVVRMKEVENDWIRMVRCLSFCPVRASAFHIAPPPPAFLSMMITHQNSISLEDTNNMVTKKLCEPL